MERIWLKSYPKGVPAEIDVNTYASVRDVFEESCAKFSTRRAFTCMGKSITFAELDELSRAFGAYIQGKGLKKGDRVALMMPNILQYPVCLFGILRAGCTVVNVNPLYTARELEHQLTDSGAQIIVVVENFAHTHAGRSDRQDSRQAHDRDQHRRNAGPERAARRFRPAPREENGSGLAHRGSHHIFSSAHPRRKRAIQRGCGDAR